MKEFFAEQKEAISQHLARFVDQKREDLQRVHPMGADSADRILDFTSKGKMLRGGLTALAYQLTRSDDPQTAMPADVIDLGVVMELFQSGFLIHDDIMDRDEQRRGAQSVYAQYGLVAAEHGFHDSYHIGESLGICVGDIAFFMAFEILSDLDRHVPGRMSLSGMCAKELSYVGVAQMMDVYWGKGDENVREEDVIALYRYKTGRYTFSLPLLGGAALAGATKEQVDLLDQIGELLGVLFQIKDDELGLYGDEAQLGKPIGSDIREGKKTPFTLRLLQRAGSQEKQRLREMLGSNRVTEDDVHYVRDLVDSYGIHEELQETCRAYAAQAREKIEEIEGVQEKYRTTLLELLDYSLNRVK